MRVRVPQIHRRRPRYNRFVVFRGQLDIASSIDESARQFPSAGSATALQRVSALACLSRLVGMICPGLHSIFSSLQLDFVDENLDETVISFRVIDVDERFRLVRMSIVGSGFSGSPKRSHLDHPYDRPLSEPSRNRSRQLNLPKAGS
jgi:hypothetical protein